jgi:hypothetical protein
VPPLEAVQIRAEQQPDQEGYGTYYARRRDKKSPTGSRPHLGVDIVATPDEPVFAPIGGKVVIGGAYANPTKAQAGYKAVRIIANDGRAVVLRYVDPDPDLLSEISKNRNYRVAPGTLVGKAKSLQPLDPGITDHIHVETEETPFGVKIDPTPLVKSWIARSSLPLTPEQRRFERMEQRFPGDN